ncbi:MAG: enoyl-ACP reductase [Gemmatimonadetes bacterium]|nr:enoyl-ACP reductase [Gemmatimonadota bacterium]
MTPTRLFEGKRVLVFGVANERSIAWGIAQAMHEHGASFIFTYAGEALEKRVRPLAEVVGADLIRCDVTNDEEVEACFEQVRAKWDGIDVLVHAIGFANREDLDGRFIDTSRAGFLLAHDVSVFSLVLLARHAAPLLAARRGNIITMSYYGSEKVVQNYNVMGVAKAALEASVRYLAADLGPDGIRVNAVSAGPIKTLAASGIRGFKTILSTVEEKTPLRRNVTQADVGNAALFLCSDLGGGVTGEIMYVDAGYNIMGL